MSTEIWNVRRPRPKRHCGGSWTQAGTRAAAAGDPATVGWRGWRSAGLEEGAGRRGTELARASGGAHGWKAESRGSGLGDAPAGCCGRGRPRQQPGFTYPARATTIPARRGPAGPDRGPSPVRTLLPASPIGCRARDASGSANQRREARFGNFFPLGPGASPPSYGGEGGRGCGRCGLLARKTGVERSCRRLRARGATHPGTPSRLSFTLVAFIRSCPKRDKGAVGIRTPGFRSNWYRVTLESALPKSRNVIYTTIESTETKLA